MKNEEILVNEEIMEAAEDVVEVNSGNGFKMVAGIGLAALVGFGAYKLGKLAYAKIKAKKEANMMDVDADGTFEEDFEEVE